MKCYDDNFYHLLTIHTISKNNQIDEASLLGGFVAPSLTFTVWFLFGLEKLCPQQYVTVVHTCAEKTGCYPLVEVKIYAALQTLQALDESGGVVSAALQDEELISNKLVVETLGGKNID